MGVVAELIKAAETKEAVDPSVMSKRLDELQQRAAAAPPASSAFSSLSKVAPTSEQESTRNALKWLAITGVGAAGLGALMRGLRARNEGTRRQKLIEDINPYAGMPGREITIPLPHMAKKSSEEKAAIGLAVPAAIAATAGPAVARSVGSSVGGMWDKLKGGASKGMEHLFAPTGSALDKPWFLPAAIAAGLGGGYLGYSKLDSMLEGSRKRRSERQIEKARKEFEDALRAQYRESELFEDASKGRKAPGAGEGSFKFSAAGMMGVVADAFAQAHVAGELQEQFDQLEKSAAPGEEQPGFGWGSFKGTGRKALGGYLAALALLTAAGGAAGYSFVKGREGKRRKYEIAKDIMRRRSLATPPTVTVEPA